MRDKLRLFLQNEINLKHIPGAVLHISYQGEVMFQEAIGHRVVHPEQSPMTTDTIFDLASLTKVVATLPATLKLMDRGEIRLDDQVTHFLPEFGQNGKEEITLRDLLTHTSGLPAHKQFYMEKLTSEQVLERIYVEELEVPPGDKVIYSDLGFIILYKIIETVTGEKFTQFVDENIFKPLGMIDTAFNPTYNRERYAATEYNEKLRGYKQGIVHDDNTESMGGISGHAGLFSSIQDLQKFAEMIENEGVYKGKGILSQAALRLSRTNFSKYDSEYRGLGWMLKSPTRSSCGDLFSEESYGHTGFTGTSMWFDPVINLHVILLTNRVHYGRESHIIRLRPRLHNIIRSYF